MEIFASVQIHTKNADPKHCLPSLFSVTSAPVEFFNGPMPVLHTPTSVGEIGSANPS
jgi:hypothetical protein